MVIGRRCIRTWISVLTLASTLAAGCSAPTRKGSQPVGVTGEAGEKKKVVTQVELQESLQRFCGNFAERIGQAGPELYTSPDPRIRKSAMRQVLLYQSSAVDITTEPQPEVALLDMLVFITLAKESYEGHWQPQVFGPAGAGIAQAFRQSESEIWTLGDRVMSAAQQNTLRNLIRDWQRQNPGQYKVEAVRLSGIAQNAGIIAEAQGAQAGGLLAGVSSAVERIDEALLMANRGFFLAQRMPFLLRLQARLLTSEILDDLNASNVVVESGGVAQMAGVAAQEGKSFAQSLYPLIPHVGMLTKYLGSTERITDKSLALLSALERTDAADRIERVARVLMIYFLVFALALSVVGWGGLFCYRRALARASARDRDKAA